MSKARRKVAWRRGVSGSSCVDSSRFLDDWSSQAAGKALKAVTQQATEDARYAKEKTQAASKLGYGNPVSKTEISKPIAALYCRRYRYSIEPEHTSNDGRFLSPITYELNRLGDKVTNNHPGHRTRGKPKSEG